MKLVHGPLMGLLLLPPAIHAGEVPRKAGEGADAPHQGFATLAELYCWSATSSFGGGTIVTYQLSGQNVYAVIRSFTAGRASTELSFYIAKPDGKGLVRVLHLPQRTTELRTRQAEETLLVELYDFRKGTWVTAMTLTQHAFTP